MERVKKLIKIVHQKIMNLDFPETNQYKVKDSDGEEKEDYSLKNILAFEEDLLNGKI